MAAELLTLVVVVKSVKFVLRRGRHDWKRERAQCTMHNALANSSKRSALAIWVRVSECVDQVQVLRDVKSLGSVRIE